MAENSISQTNASDTAYHHVRRSMAEAKYIANDCSPNRYVLVITNTCNLKCPFCFQVKEKNANAMTTREWLALIEQLPDDAWVTITGGEPLLFDGFEEIFTRVTETFNCNIISNGLLLSEKVTELLLSRERFRTLSISIDSIGNGVRGVSPGTWEAVEARLRHFGRLSRSCRPDVVFDVKTMVLDENAAQLFDIHRYCVEEIAFDTHAYQFLKGSPLQHADRCAPFDEIYRKSSSTLYRNWNIIRQQLELIRQYNISRGGQAFLHPRFGDLNSETPLDDVILGLLNNADYDPKLFQPCKSVWESVHINNDGNLIPCMAISMGNIKEKPLYEVLTSEIFMKFRDVIRSCGTVQGCNRCGYLLPF